jgi:hypothetical protein
LCRGNGAEVANTQFCSHLGISAGTTFNSFCLSQRVVNILRDLAPRNNCFIICVSVSLLWHHSTLLPLMLLLRKCCGEVGYKMFGYLGFLCFCPSNWIETVPFFL